MVRRGIQIIIVMLMLAGFAGSGYLWHEKTKAEKQITALNSEIETGKKRLRAAQKKYTQEKAKLGNCMRMNLAEKSRNAKLHREIQKVTARRDELAGQVKAAETKRLAVIAAFEKKMEKLKQSKEQVVKSRQKLLGKYKASVRSDREKAGQIDILTAEKQEVEFELEQTEKTLERNRKHNERLCEIAEELAMKYKEKAGARTEPFTKLGMVELEHLIQTYIKKIDKEKVTVQ